MKITLMIEGKEKIFKTPFVPARAYRKLLEYDKKIDYMNMDTEDYDELIGFACEVFGNQFTIDEFWDGLHTGDLNKTLLDLFAYIRTGEIPKEKEDDSKNNEGK